ncbi:TlpA family protein disulfide reductase [Nocardiopsis sp. M1B1]|uniref:TlpA family protein disulfide reductase n=1 Tax=Nocardiopsis sp. M1B1 TaxID=3450454 RepID=UPI004039D08D
MFLVVAAVALVGALGLVNLLLSIGVIRRLRQHTELLENRPRSADDDVPASAVPVGTSVGAFRATSTRGAEVVFDASAERLLVAFVSPDCSPCRKRLPLLLDHLAQNPDVRALAVVIEEGGAEADMVAQLEPTVSVVVQPWEGELPRLFDIQGTPSFITVENGVVTATSVFAPGRGGAALSVVAG